MTNSCTYCALPVSGRPRLIRIGGQNAPFCCWGCVVVFQVMGSRGERGQSTVPLLKLAIGVAFAMVVMLISWSHYLDRLLGGGESSGSQPEALLYRFYLLFAATAVMVILGYPIAAGALQSVRRGSPGLDLLIAVGVFAAYGRSLFSTLTGSGEIYYDTATMILVLITVGRYLESEAKARTTSALRTLFDLTPRQATVIRDGQEERVDAASVRVGEVVKVWPGETFPVDGRVREGEGSADEAALTGEGTPAFKRPGDHVLAGTLNLDGAFRVVTESAGEQTVVGRMARFLEEARQTKAPIVRIADRVAAAWIPLVMVLALVVFTYWSWQAGFERGLMVALAVLLITCPCALGIAAPLAVWRGLAEAARGGTLIRSGEVLESLAMVDHVFFDKTGTLTTGTLVLSSVVVGQGQRGLERELMSLAASLSCLSQHPVSQALVRFAAESKTPMRPVRDFRFHAGLGVQGRVDGHGSTVYLGSRLLMDRAGLVDEERVAEPGGGEESKGGTLVYLGWEGRVRALFVLGEEVRPEAVEAVGRLQRMGVTVSVLTGDGRPAADALRDQLGIADVRWGLLPEDKVRLLEEAKGAGGRAGQAHRKRRVAMVGDGVNDGPALAAADVGMALGCGTDIAREAAGVNLLGSDLSQIPELLALARQTRRLIAENLFWAFFYNAIGIPLAALGLLTPVLSALAMVLSSLFVVGNSLHRRRPFPGGASA